MSCDMYTTPCCTEATWKPDLFVWMQRLEEPFYVPTHLLLSSMKQEFPGMKYKGRLLFCLHTKARWKYHHDHYCHLHLANLDLGHLLTHSCLSHPDVSVMVFPGSFCCPFASSFLLSLVICYEAFCLYAASSFFCNPVFCPKLGLYLIPLQFIHFIICPRASCCFSLTVLCSCYSSCVSCFNSPDFTTM